MRCNLPEAVHRVIAEVLSPRSFSCQWATTPHWRSASFRIRRTTWANAIRSRFPGIDCVDLAMAASLGCPRCPFNTRLCRGCAGRLARALRGDPGDLFDRGDARAGLLQAVFANRDHALGAGHLGDLG